MRIRAGFEISYQCYQPTPMLLLVSIHPSRAPDLLTQGAITYSAGTVVSTYQDRYDNICTRILAPPGLLTISTDFTVSDTGQMDDAHPGAIQHPVEELPSDAMVYLLGSRYCETDRPDGHRLVAVRPYPAWLGPRGRHLRLRAQAHPLRLPAGAPHPHRLGRLPGAGRRLPRLSRISPSHSAAA